MPESVALDGGKRKREDSRNTAADYGGIIKLSTYVLPGAEDRIEVGHGEVGRVELLPRKGGELVGAPTPDHIHLQTISTHTLKEESTSSDPDSFPAKGA
jgi:hypothetical protein